jgi:hypothetical protein
MTDLAAPDAATIADDEQRRRVEQLQRRRASRPLADQPLVPSSTRLGGPTVAAPRSRSGRSRPHPAIGARIGAAGFGLVTMFGLVATMGLARPSAATSAPEPAVAAPAEVVVVIHRTGTASPTDATTSVATANPTSAPITLTARPTVKPAAAQAQAAPAARTNGSK